MNQSKIHSNSKQKDEEKLLYSDKKLILNVQNHLDQIKLDIYKDKASH